MPKYNDLTNAREKLINQTITSAAIFSFIAIISSLSRSLELGWQPVFTMHLIILVIVVVLSIIKKRLPLNAKGHILFILFLFIAGAGVYFFRTLGGYHIALIVIALSTMIYGYKTGLFYALIFVLSLVLIGTLHLQGVIKTELDFGKYTNQTTTWISLIAGTIFSIIVLINSINLFYGFFIDSFKKLNEQSQELSVMYESLKISERKYRLIFEGSNDGFLFIDKQYRIMSCNDSYLKLVGYDISELKGIDYKLLIHNKEFDWDMHLTDVSYSLNNKIEFEIVHKNGEVIPVEASIYNISHNDLDYFWAIVRDLRKEKALEKEIFNSMIIAEENERERYAKELHDGLGPLLSTGLIYVYTIAEESNQTPIKEYANRASDILLEATTTVKEISNNLSPIILKEYGIAQATRSFIEKIQQATQINFIIKEVSPTRFKETVEFTVYRTLVELVNNSIKYSKAQNVKIEFEDDHHYYRITYEDDGNGFDYKNAIADHKGFGLLNLENRIRKINGSYSYFTTPGNGVHVTIILNQDML